MTKIAKNNNNISFEMMALTGLFMIQGLVATNASAILPNGGDTGWNDHRDDDTNRYHRNLIWPFTLGECQGSCGTIRSCNSGLSCARNNQATLTAAGLDSQFAYCRAPLVSGRRFFCYDPKKLPTKPNKTICSPSFGYNGVDLRNAVKDYVSGDPNKIANLTSMYGNISDWCTSAVSDWSYTFSYASFNEDISRWDTSNATTMDGTFNSALSFNQDISKWDTSNVKTMIAMFFEAYTFNQDISKWDTSKVKTMSYMFFEAYTFNQDISKWDTSNVEVMSYMFQQAYAFNQDISKWNTSKVRTMASMFYYSNAFNQNISSWDTSNVEDMSFMFYDASAFNQDISRWNTCQVKTMNTMFSFTYSFNQDISRWNTSQVMTMSFMFSNAYSFNQDISRWNTSRVMAMSYMFAYAYSFNQDISKWDISTVTNIDGMFTSAYRFKKNLCAWNNKCSGSLSATDNVFLSTSCPNQTNPICGKGSFCYSC